MIYSSHLYTFKMSLDCYPIPIDSKRAIDLTEQPMALDVAYNDNLLVSVTDQCRCIVVYDLTAETDDNLVGKFSLGRDVVVDHVIFCQTGDYIACVGHKNGILSVYIVFQWREFGKEPNILELDINVNSDVDRRDKLNSIDCCQRTGNLAVSCGDTILIYEYVEDDKDGVSGERFDDDADSLHSKAETVKSCGAIHDTTDEGDDAKTNVQNFKHIISIKLAIWALKISLLENYLSITAVDHVQVLKLELLTLQIHSDGLDDQQVVGGVETQTSSDLNFRGAKSDTTTIASSSMISNTNSTTTNFSSFTNNNTNTTNKNDINHDNASRSTLDLNSDQHLNNYDIITIPQEQDTIEHALQSAGDCIVWNLNTKKLVKLPSLMHNTSTSLSSYHICHPLELLGPASESIACRVNASVFSDNYCSNQLEAVVMLCRQFDSDKDPVKSTYLQSVYLSSYEEKRRLSRSALIMSDIEHCKSISNDLANRGAIGRNEDLLKSVDYDLLASVTCFVSTLTTCFVYNLHGKRVARTQTITHPDLCLDLRPDLLNVYLLTSFGLQICSSGICDSTFRYEWSSSSDLNLSFIANNRSLKNRVLTTSRFVVMVACSMNGQCLVEYIEKPHLASLFERIVHTVEHCNCISIRSNMLTYLHATAQLALLSGDRPSMLIDESLKVEEITDILRKTTILLCEQLLHKKQTNAITNGRIDKAIKHLLDISMCDLKVLMDIHLEALESRRSKASQDKQENGDILEELSSDEATMQSDDSAHGFNQVVEQHLSNLSSPFSRDFLVNFGRAEPEEEQPLEVDYELIKIYLKHAKFSQTLLGYLVANATNRRVIRTIIDYMFEHNPRLLIKCAQRYPLNMASSTTAKDHDDADKQVDVSGGEGEGNGDANDQAQTQVQVDEEQKVDGEGGDDGSELRDRKATLCVTLLVERLKRLAELDSTGINRATVLFTLAVLYEALCKRHKCLAALAQIKPLNHLAITMCSNYELPNIDSIASVVNEHYPEVFGLFLVQLAKRDKAAARQFSSRYAANCLEQQPQ